MKTEKKRRFRPALFTLIAIANLPLALLSAMLLHGALFFPISELNLFELHPFAWLSEIEDNFLIQSAQSNSAQVLAIISFALYAAGYLLSFFSGYPRRPFKRLLLLHAQAASILAFLAAVALKPNINTAPEFIAFGIVLLIPIAYIFAAWRLERLAGALLVRLTLWFARRDQHDAANAILPLAQRFQPDNPHLRRTLGLSRHDAHDHAGAIAILAPLAGPHTDDIELLETLEDSHLRLEHWPESLHVQQRLLELDPSRLKTRHAAALAHIRLGHPDEARKLLQAAPDANHLTLQTLLLETQIATDNIPAALDTARRIEKLNDAGAQDQAIAAYRSLAHAAPQNPDAHERLAHLLLRHGEAEEARKSLERAIIADPQRHDIRSRLVQHYQSISQITRAEPHLLALLDAGRDTIDIALLHGSLLIDRGDYEKALLHLQYAEETYPGDYRFALFLAQIHLDTSALEVARDWALQALARSAGDETAKTRVRVLENRIEEALLARDLQIRRERSKREPENLQARLDLIEALARAHKTDQAIDQCETLLASDAAHRPHLIALLDAHTDEDTPYDFRLLDYLADLQLKSQNWDAVHKTALRLSQRSLDGGDLLLSEHCRRILKLAPDHIPSLRTLAQLSLRSEDWLQSLNAHERLLEIDDPKSLDYRQALFQANAHLGHAPRAIEIGETLAARRPQDLPLRLRLIQLHTEQKHYAEARVHVQAARAVDYYNTDLVRLNKKLEAEYNEHRLAELSQIIDRNPSDSQAQYEAGGLYASRGETKRSITCFQQASRDPELKNIAQIKLAHAMARLRMFDLAEETLQDTTLRIDDAQDVEIAKALVYDIAEMLEEEGEDDRALKLYKKIFREDAGFREVVDKVESLAI